MPPHFRLYLFHEIARCFPHVLDNRVGAAASASVFLSRAAPSQPGAGVPLSRRCGPTERRGSAVLSDHKRSQPPGRRGRRAAAGLAVLWCGTRRRRG
ncbi:hypothetical protein SRHO_G00114780 [Serrasalmus rhombeus]